MIVDDFTVSKKLVARSVSIPLDKNGYRISDLQFRDAYKRGEAEY
jgi:hypothetical protein